MPSKKFVVPPIDDIEGEVWADINGYEGLYQISSLGRVKSCGRTFCFIRNGVQSTRRKVEILLSHGYRGGYPRVRLYNYKLGFGEYVNIHRLVSIAFIPNPKNKPYVNHINAIRDDNRVENLEWCTPSENARHASAYGLLKSTGGKSVVPISSEDVKDICKLFSSGVRQRVIAKKYNISESRVSKIYTTNGK